MRIPDQLLQNHALPSIEATQRLAQNIAPHIRRGDSLALYGDLGAGKTCFARFLIHALGYEGDVPSPTFTLVQHYELPHFTVYHFDLYRLKSSAELEEIGWFDANADGVVVVEWPERAGNCLPPTALHLIFKLVDGKHSCLIHQNKKA